MSLDEYIDNFYFSHLEDYAKKFQPRNQFLTFANLNAEQRLVQVTIEIKLSDVMTIKDKVDWDLNDEKKNPQIFSEILIENLSPLIKDEKDKMRNIKSITNQIYHQLISHICECNKFPKFKVFPSHSLNEDLCDKCGTVKRNDIQCVNCMYRFERTTLKSTIPNIIPEMNEDANLTDRQRTLHLRQKNISIDNNNNSEFIREMQNAMSREKKICKKCGEVNDKLTSTCKNCSYRFPIISCYNIYDNSSCYCVHFWDKLNKNHIIQQLKTFSSFYAKEDFSSLKYLYERTKEIISVNYKEILTEEAFDELIAFVERIYSLFANPSATSQKAFDSAYFAKHNKPRPYINMLNYNDLENKEGWLPENDVNYKTTTTKIKQKVYDNIAKNTMINNDDIDDDINCGSNDNLTKRKRGRPKKIEIFRENSKAQNGAGDSNEPFIVLCDRVNLFKNDIIIEDDLLHYDFCGRCFEEGKLICCETCSAAYHFECLGYDKFPRGKFKCYFCKVVKLGIANSHCVTQYHIDLIAKLVEVNTECDSWILKAEHLLDVLKEHQCACFFRDPVPKEVEGYSDVVKEQRDFSLVEIKLTHWEYKTVNQFLDDLKLVWGNIKMFFKPKSFFWRQADILELFVSHLIRNEGLFERYDLNKEISDEEIKKVIEYKKVEKRKKEIENNKKNNKKATEAKLKGKKKTLHIKKTKEKKENDDEESEEDEDEDSKEENDKSNMINDSSSEKNSDYTNNKEKTKKEEIKSDKKEDKTNENKNDI